MTNDWPIQFPPPVGVHTLAPCLYLRVHDKSASWIFKYAFNGKRRELGLGGFLATTREQAERALTTVINRVDIHRNELLSGKDPLELKLQTKQEAKLIILRKRGGTLRQAVRKYHEACVEPLVSWKYARQWIQETEADLPMWLLERPVVDITSEDVLLALREIPDLIRERLAKARNKAKYLDVSLRERVDSCRQRLDQLYEWLVRYEMVDANPLGVRRNTRAGWQKRFDMEVPPLPLPQSVKSKA